MKVSVDRELLVKYVRKECTVEEQRQVAEFLFQPEWEQALEEVLKEDFQRFSYTEYTESENIAWNQRFRKSYIQSPGLFSRYNKWIGYAAACVILFTLGLWYFNTSQRMNTARYEQTAMLQHTNPRGQRSIVTLPDGSVVHLGALSSIRYPKVFASADRSVILTGEAFFEVKHDKSHPFTVQTGAIQTRVLGTSFKIDAFHHIVVSVATGKVQVAKLDRLGKTEEPLAILTPGQQVSWNAKTDNADLTTVDIDEIREWTDGKVTFANTSLKEIVETLERWYNVDISFADKKLEKTRLSLILRATVPIQHALDVICSTAHLKYHLVGNKITITH